MAQEGVFGSVLSQQAWSTPLLVDRGRSATNCCTRRHLTSRQRRICSAYQQETEETFRRKAPSTPPGPDTRRAPPPPPPPPPAPPGGQFGGQTRRTMLALVGICAVAYGYNVTQHPDAAPVQETPAGPAAPAGQAALARAATTAGPARATAKSAEVYANNALREKRVWPNDEPENPYTQVIFWRKAPYARLRKNGWMRIYGMQSGRNGKVELIMEARGGNQYTLEVPLRQVKPWDMQYMNALFNSLIDWDSHLKPFAGKIKNKNPALQ